MIRMSHFAAPVVLGLGLSLGLAGCANHERQVIPNDAVILQEGRHNVSATINRPGMVYVYDNSNHNLLYSGRVSKGDVVTVNPMENTISVNNRTVSQQPLDDMHHYRIYEEEGQINSQGSAIGQTDATEEENNGQSTVIRQEGNSTVVHEPEGKTTVITKPNSTVIQHHSTDNGQSE